MPSQERILDASKVFRSNLSRNLLQIIEKISEDPDAFADEYKVEIPEMNAVDLTIEDIASLVARASNNFGKLAALGGEARTLCGALEGQYKRKYKVSMRGPNAAEREIHAVEATEEEYRNYELIQMLVDMIEPLELRARIASETARKLLDKVSNMEIASRRESAGSYLEGDFD